MKLKIVVLSLLCALPLQAQTFYVSKPNCHVLSPHIDNPYDNKHYYTQPALAWDAEYAALSLGTGVLLHKIGAPDWAAAAIPTVGYGLVPHLIGFTQHRYRIDVGHWLQVLWDRSTPTVWMMARHDSLSYLKAAAVWAAVEAPLSCFDR